MKKRQIFVGTSGWMYKHWGERFYPKDLKKDYLKFYANEFQTVEINSSFYHMPREKFFENWKKETPKNFIFAVKLNRYITHRKRLILDDESKPFLMGFLRNAQALEKKLATILIQLPPSFKINIERLEQFLIFYCKQIKDLEYRPLTAIEFRHDSWNNEETINLLKKYKVSLVLVGTPQIKLEKFSANFVYIRMHGDTEHSSNYMNKDLIKLKENIDRYPQNIKKIYIYFNNDYSAYAIDNARFLVRQFE